MLFLALPLRQTVKMIIISPALIAEAVPGVIGRIVDKTANPIPSVFMLHAFGFTAMGALMQNAGIVAIIFRSLGMAARIFFYRH